MQAHNWLVYPTHLIDFKLFHQLKSDFEIKKSVQFRADFEILYTISKSDRPGFMYFYSFANPVR